jgi:peroxiredoxin
MSLRDAINKLHVEEEWKDERTRRSAVLKVVEAEERRKLLRVGEPAPEFSVIDPQTGAIASSSLLESGDLVVSFYRGLWCSFCQSDLQRVAEIAPQVRRAGASVIAIGHGVEGDIRTKFRDAYGSDVPLFDDTDGKIAELFGIRWSLQDEKLIAEELGTENIGLLREGVAWMAPIQARFVISRSRTVIFSDAVFDFGQESNPAAVLPVLNK